MLAAVRSATVLGIDAYDVTVEVDVVQGLPQWTIVGLPVGGVKESRERVASAIVNAGFVVPPRRITINLAPGDTRKEGTAFDVPIAIGVLAATGQLDPDALREVTLVGELGLDGALRAVRGVLPVARRVAAAGGGTLVVPPANVAEAALVSGVRVAAPPTLAALVEALRRGCLPAADATSASVRLVREDPVDFADVVGQASAKRALEVAAAGGHNILLVGPPGAGKTMLARRLATILPPLSGDEALAVLAVHSVAGALATGVRATRPFRAPHHTISSAGLVGGGSMPRPGEVSLAHLGVLFLDEMLEFPRHVLDALRQPLEDGHVVVARTAQTVTFPARFTLVGAMNPCPCGGAGDPTRICTCSAAEIARYRGRLSGPLADRIDMHVAVGAVPLRVLGERADAEPSAAVRARVERARALQRERFSALPEATCNAHVPGRWLDTRTPVDAAARELLRAAAEQLGLSARAYHKVLKVARTIADLDGDAGLHEEAVVEALRYRAVPATTAAAVTSAASAPRLASLPHDGR